MNFCRSKFGVVQSWVDVSYNALVMFILVIVC